MLKRWMVRLTLPLTLFGGAIACAPPASTGDAPRSSVVAAPAKPRDVTISLIGINDLHGHVESTPLYGGYVAAVRKAREKDGAALVLDAGDMFQGTLESNLGEGVAVLHAYGALGVAAAAIGNHEFDYGPVGPRSTPEAEGDDPRGALGSLIRSAPFAMLSANVRRASDHALALGAKASVAVDAAGLSVGIIGVTSANTLTTTASKNVKGLEIEPLAAAIEREVKALRAAKVDLVVVLAHAGGKCAKFTHDLAADGCEDDAEIFQLARALPAKSVDAIIAGHTHAGVAETVNGVPIIESFSYGKAFGRVDMHLQKTEGAPATVTSVELFEPRSLCVDTKASPVDCDPGSYEGVAIQRDAKVAEAIAPDLELVKAKRAELLGVVLSGPFRREHAVESEEGNLFVDLLHAAHPEATVVMTNGGGLRQDLPKGPLTYGALFEAFPFDNKITTATLTGAELVELLTSHMSQSGGVLSVSGVRVAATCKGDELVVTVRYENGKEVAKGDAITLLANDFMMTGGDSFWGSVAPKPITETDELVRDVLAAQLAKQATLDPAKYLDRKKPRMDLAKPRPIRCKP